MFNKFFYFLSLLFLCTQVSANSKFDLTLELGSIWQNRNDSQIPGSTGTRTALDQFDSGPFLHHRIELYYKINNKHGLRLVYAPLDIGFSGRTGGPVLFDGITFDGTRNVDVNYKFNSYRLTYIYSFWGFNENQLNFGFTAKVRDAETSFSQNGITQAYDNLGFVPLIYFEYQKSLGQNLYLNFNMDAAYASQGRAIDAALKIRKKYNEALNFGIGLRTLEGGADNEKVYTFSWFTYAVTDLVFRF
jgi:hypothetical protein